MAPTRRQLLQIATAGTAASAGFLATAQPDGGTPDGASTRDDGGDDGSAAFCPEVRVSALRATVWTDVDRPAPDRVAVHTADGTVHEFTEGLADAREFGYESPSPEHGIDRWHGPIERVEVDRGSRTVSVESEDDAAIDVDCDVWRGPAGAADFTTEYEHATKRYDPPAGDRDAFGSPGRRLRTVYGPAGDLMIEFDHRDCEPDGEPAVRFDCTSVTVEPEEFVNGSEQLHLVRLYFADGTDQQLDPGDGEFYEPPATFEGTGEHEGKVIETLDVWNDEAGGASFVYENPDLEACLDGSAGEGGSSDGENGDDEDGDDQSGDGVSIAAVDVDGGTYGTGDEVATDVTVRNDGAEDETLFVGYSALGPDGIAYTNDGTTGTATTVGAGETATVTVAWTVEDEAPEGSYGAHVALWAETDPDALETQLDDRIVDDAFAVE